MGRQHAAEVTIVGHFTNGDEPAKKTIPQGIYIEAVALTSNNHCTTTAVAGSSTTFTTCHNKVGFLMFGYDLIRMLMNSQAL